MKTNCSQNVGFHFPMCLQQCSPADADLQCMAVPQHSCTQMGRRRWPPLGGVQSAGHRRCANSVPDSFPTGSVQSQLANLDILSSSSFAQFDLKCSFPYPFLSPGAWGSPEPSSKKSLSAACWLMLVDFFAFQTALEKLHRKNIEKSEKIQDLGFPKPFRNSPKNELKSMSEKTCYFC